MEDLDSTATDTAGRVLGENLARWRHDHALLLRQVAPALGISVAALNAWERGRNFPTAEHLDKIAAYTGIPLCRLFCEAPQDQCPLPAREKEFPASDRGQHTGHRDP